MLSQPHLEMPTGKADKFGDPTEWVNVRITDGKWWVRPTDKLSMGGGSGVGSTIGNSVLTAQVVAGITAMSLAASPIRIMNGLIVEALSTNTASVYIGGIDVDSNGGFELQPGQSTSLAINDISKVYVIGNGSDKVSYITTQ